MSLLKAASAVTVGLLLSINASAQSSDVPSGKAAITVHGHWTIEVQNPDGSLVSRREFENALVPGIHLAQILGRGVAAGRWAIDLGGFAGGADPCVHTPFQGQPTPIVCQMYEPTPGSGPFINSMSATTLTVSENGGVIELKGHITPSNSPAQVGAVKTLIGMCDNTVPPRSCGGVFDFTAKPLDAPIAVQPGQIVQVKVLIRFS
jgi:hypothetical protein